MGPYSQLYWLTRLDVINGVFLALTITSGIVFICYFVFLALSFDDDTLKEWDEKYGSIKKWARFIFIISICILIFLPTKKDVILIVAGGKTIDFIKSDTSINKIPSQTTRVISDFLDKAIKEIKKENK